MCVYSNDNNMFAEGMNDLKLIIIIICIYNVLKGTEKIRYQFVAS